MTKSGTKGQRMITIRTLKLLALFLLIPSLSFAAEQVLGWPHNTPILVTGSTGSTVIDGNCAEFDSNGNIVDSGGVCGGTGAPTDATYVTQTSNATLSAEQALDALASGIMRIDTAAGVITSLTDSSGISDNISDETGTGVMCFATAPTFTTSITVTSGATIDADGVDVVTGNDIAVFDVIDDIRGSQLEAFPEMQQIRASYGKVISKYNLIKNKIKAGSLQNNLIKDFGDRELKEAFEELVPADILKEAVEFRKIHVALDFTGRVGRRAAEGAAIVGAGGFIGKKIGLFGD